MAEDSAFFRKKPCNLRRNMVSYNMIRRLVKEWGHPLFPLCMGKSPCITSKEEGREGALSAKKKESTTEIAARLAQPVLEELGLTLWDLRFEKEGSLWFLRYFIDREEGLTIEDCEAFSRAVDQLLDQADPISQSYTLEVSSPGIERELTKDWHYEQCMGMNLSVRLIRPVDGVREFTGTLTGYQEGRVTLLLPGETEMSFGTEEASFVRLYHDYDSEDFGTEDNEGE